MECIYIPKYNENQQIFKVPDDEANHLKVLRLKERDKILVSDGIGNLFFNEIIKKEKNNYYLKTLSVENKVRKAETDLAIGILKHRDRLEFALEKAAELGIRKFIPITSSFTEKSKLNIQRLQAKAVSALKQSKNPYIMEISELINFKNIDFNNYNSIILADINGKIFSDISISSPALIIVGPEGGFSSDELEFIKSNYKISELFLSENRLRTETAAITAISLVSNLINIK